MIPYVLFVIFGWPLRTKTYGVAQPGYCPHCRNDSAFYLVKQRRWFSLFFLPILPLSRANYYLVCEICHLAGDIDRADVSQYKKMVSTTEEYVAGELTAAAYNRRLDEIKADVSAIDEQDWSEGEGDGWEDVGAGASEQRYCGQCGELVAPTDNFCPFCGERTQEQSADAPPGATPDR